jgi:hypothetical protein
MVFINAMIADNLLIHSCHVFLSVIHVELAQTGFTLPAAGQVFNFLLAIKINLRQHFQGEQGLRIK